MLDRMGGMQIPIWNMWYPNEKKTTLDQTARGQMYKFVRDHGPRPSNCNQFMEWTDGQVHLPGEKLEGCYRGRENAKTIKSRPFTLKSFVAWFLDDVLVKMLPTMRKHGITWVGCANRLGQKPSSSCSLDLKSPKLLGRTRLFQSRGSHQIHTSCLGDGMLQRMDASFLKAFLNPSTTQSHMQNKVFPCIFTCKAKEIPSCGLLST